jgi:hypothetical protein
MDSAARAIPFLLAVFLVLMGLAAGGKSEPLLDILTGRMLPYLIPCALWLALRKRRNRWRSLLQRNAPTGCWLALILGLAAAAISNHHLCFTADLLVSALAVISTALAAYAMFHKGYTAAVVMGLHTFCWLQLATTLEVGGVTAIIIIACSSVAVLMATAVSQWVVSAKWADVLLLVSIFSATMAVLFWSTFFLNDHLVDFIVFNIVWMPISGEPSVDSTAALVISAALLLSLLAACIRNSYKGLSRWMVIGAVTGLGAYTALAIAAQLGVFLLSSWTLPFFGSNGVLNMLSMAVLLLVDADDKRKPEPPPAIPAGSLPLSAGQYEGVLTLRRIMLTRAVTSELAALFCGDGIIRIQEEELHRVVSGNTTGTLLRCEGDIGEISGLISSLSCSLGSKGAILLTAGPECDVNELLPLAATIQKNLFTEIEEDDVNIAVSIDHTLDGDADRVTVAILCT